MACGNIHTGQQLTRWQPLARWEPPIVCGPIIALRTLKSYQNNEEVIHIYDCARLPQKDTSLDMVYPIMNFDPSVLLSVNETTVAVFRRPADHNNSSSYHINRIELYRIAEENFRVHNSYSYGSILKHQLGLYPVFKDVKSITLTRTHLLVLEHHQRIPYARVQPTSEPHLGLNIAVFSLQYLDTGELYSIPIFPELQPVGYEIGMAGTLVAESLLPKVVGGRKQVWILDPLSKMRKRVLVPLPNGTEGDESRRNGFAFAVWERDDDKGLGRRWKERWYWEWI
ncbi:hypothetical protein HDV00_010940 [Rhizophlyctis rosea]|nr:hypothetical protein HDV00_010940 [Rhizophlyctis rosea]